MSIEYFVQWLANGRFSTTKKAWDVSRSTRLSLSTWKKHGVDQIEDTQQVICNKLDQEFCSGNGSLMRIAPIGVALWTNSDLSRKAARENSRATHPALACVEACEAFTELICLAVNGRFKPGSFQHFPNHDLIQCQAKIRINYGKHLYHSSSHTRPWLSSSRHIRLSRI